MRERRYKKIVEWREAMRIVFPNVPAVAIQRAEDFVAMMMNLLGESSGEWMVRGSCAKAWYANYFNNQEGFKLDQAVRSAFTRFATKVSDGFLSQNNFWKNVLGESVSVPDIDIRVALSGNPREQLRDLLESLLRKLGPPTTQTENYFGWEGRGIALRINRGVFPSGYPFCRANPGRHYREQWEIWILDSSKRPQIKIDFANFPPRISFPEDDYRWGTMATRVHWVSIAFILKNSGKLFLGFGHNPWESPESPIFIPPFDLIPMLWCFVHQAIWGVEPAYSGDLWRTVNYLSPNRIKEAGRLILTLLLASPVDFVVAGYSGMFKFLQPRILGIEKIEPIELIHKMFPSISRSFWERMRFGGVSILRRMKREEGYNDTIFSPEQAAFVQRVKDSYKKTLLQEKGAGEDGAECLLRGLKALGILPNSAGVEELLSLLTPQVISKLEYFRGKGDPFPSWRVVPLQG